MIGLNRSVSILMKKKTNTQLIFTCSNSTVQTLEKGLKYVQS